MSIFNSIYLINPVKFLLILENKWASLESGCGTKQNFCNLLVTISIADILLIGFEFIPIFVRALFCMI